MRQTAEHLSSIGTDSACSCHGLIPVRGRTDRSRAGFTLVEVVVAAAILLILLIALAGSFARGVEGFKQAQLLTMGQNLAEFQIEDLKNLAPSVLNQLVRGDADHVPVGYHDINYPYPTLDPLAPGYDASVAANDSYPWMYDSGRVSTDFVLDGITQIDTYSIAFMQSAADPMPVIPTDAQVLLGSNIVVQVYGDDPNPMVGLRYWYDYDTAGWYYLWTDASGTVQRTNVTLTDPADTLVYYRITLQKEAFPLFSKQVQIAQYDVSLPAGSDPWDPNVATQYRDSTTDSRREFEYRVTIWYKQNGAERVLFKTEGSIASPIGVVPVGGRRSS
ncbi:MAG: prepilin-type N-terminal cleavage/methylation domain-containing protein [Candidatus Cryosericum sp.]